MTDFSGTWHANLHTPIGAMGVVIELTEEDGVISGTARNDSETVAVKDAHVEGGHLTWTQDVTKPMRLSLKFDVTVDGDDMVGTAKAGFLPASKLSGRRVHT